MLKSQMRLSFDPSDSHTKNDTDRSSSDVHLPDTFRRLYYQLYGNSNVSRAEGIMDDISLILLFKLVEEKNKLAQEELVRFQSFDQTANEALLPILYASYPNLIEAQHKFHLDDNLIRWAFDELRDVSLTSSPAHVLGDAFQALIGPSLRGDRGQFFTPKSLVRAMVNIIDPRPGESVLDPACGTGGFLAETHIYQSKMAAAEGPTGRIVGIDKDYDLARFSGALLEILTAGRATIVHSNSLNGLDWEQSVDSKGNDLFDVILTNPPFGARIGIRDSDILRQFDFGYRWSRVKGVPGWIQTNQMALSQHPQILFLELCVRKLKPGGRLGIVLPEGVFGNRGQGFVWSWLREQGHIFALLDCPRTTFQPSTDTKTNVLFFEKHLNETDSSKSDEKVRVAVAYHCGHDRRGRSQLSDGAARPDDLQRLGEEYHRRRSSPSGWLDVSLTDPEYIIPRYYVDRVSLTQEEKQLIGSAPIATLSDLTSSGLLTIRKGHEPGSDTYGTGNVPFIRTSDITNLEMSADPTNGVSEEVYEKYSTLQGLEPEDVLIVVDGRYRIGKTALITANNYRCVVQSHFRILRALDPSLLNAYELLFALNLPSVRLRVRNLVFVQSTLGTLGNRLLELRIPVLSGDGPWRHSVDNFRRNLLQRDKLLAELLSIDGGEYDL